MGKTRCGEINKCNLEARSGHLKCIKRVERYFELGQMNNDGNEAMGQCTTDVLNNLLQCKDMASDKFKRKTRKLRQKLSDQLLHKMEPNEIREEAKK